MDKPLISPQWAYRGLFVGLALALLFLRLLPLTTEPTRYPAPDVLLCITFVWVLRRPDFVPAPLIAAVFLLEDLVLLRPPGLWAVIVLAGTEFIRSREAFTRELGFPIEWALVSAVMVMMFLAYRLAFLVAFMPEPGFFPSVVQIAGSILLYPVIVAASRFGFGVRKLATGEVDALGRRM